MHHGIVGRQSSAIFTSQELLSLSQDSSGESRDTVDPQLLTAFSFAQPDVLVQLENLRQHQIQISEQMHRTNTEDESMRLYEIAEDLSSVATTFETKLSTFETHVRPIRDGLREEAINLYVMSELA